MSPDDSEPLIFSESLSFSQHSELTTSLDIFFFSDKQSPCASQQVVWHVRGARDAWVLECREQLPNLLPSAEFLRALGLGCFPTLHNG